MNIVKISGSPAQQMFQYAFYYALLQNDPDARLHVPSEKWINSRFHLPRFVEATPNDLRPFGKGSLGARVVSIFKKPLSEIITEPADHRFVGDLLNKKDTYFDGEWLSPRYFASVEDDIKKAFSVPEKVLPSSSTSMVNMLKQGKTVVIQVHEPNSADNTCTADYYNWAVANILSTFHNPHFYVFTTDIEWVKQNINFQNAKVEIVQYPAETETSLLAYFIRARHIIMANRLVSWWAAWLNANDDKIVIAPQKWAKNADYPDLMPIHWTLIPTT
ncbi:MAG: alpha-1,2-fucosyltransferase [Muribaculaceae bacterium]|nr:alpha-1,2-fucosyltransferase [Muribaculaceae bacterium]